MRGSGVDSQGLSLLGIGAGRRVEGRGGLDFGLCRAVLEAFGERGRTCWVL